MRVGVPAWLAEQAATTSVGRIWRHGLAGLASRGATIVPADPRRRFRRAKVDEVLVTSRLASRLLARSALYPGLTELVTDIVSGGEGSELYRVALPEEYAGMTADQLASSLRADHMATLLAVVREGTTHTNPDLDFQVRSGDDLVIVAESLGDLEPLQEAPEVADSRLPEVGGPAYGGAAAT